MNQPIRPRRIPKTVTTDAMRTLFTLAGVVNFYVTKVVNFLIDEDIRGSVKDGDISYLSPVGKSLLLRKVGDVIEVKAPGGIFHYKIKSIRLQCGFT